MRPISGISKHLPALLAWLAAAGSIFALNPWNSPVPIEARLALEMAQPLPGVNVGGTTMPVGVLYGSNPRLRLALIDPKGAGSVAFSTIDAAGTNFALGTIGEISSGQIGGSYVTSGFDLRFWTCAPPCSSVSTFPIDTAQTWIDSSSAAAGSDFLAGGLLNAAGSYQIFKSANGSTWTPLRVLSPAGGIYRNFDGGERVALAVDAQAANASTALNCVFYETSTRTGTEKRLDCANGATPFSNVLVISDVEDPGGQAGPLIENRFLIQDGVVWGAFTRRSDNTLYALRDVPGQAPIVTPLGPAPSGPEFFGLTLGGHFTFASSQHLSLYGEPALQLDFRLDESSAALADYGPGPAPGLEGPIALAPSPPGCLGTDCVGLSALHNTYWFNLVEGTVSGLGLSSRPLALFEDGFETSTTGRWSVTSP